MPTMFITNVAAPPNDPHAAEREQLVRAIAAHPNNQFQAAYLQTCPIATLRGIATLAAAGGGLIGNAAPADGLPMPTMEFANPFAGLPDARTIGGTAPQANYAAAAGPAPIIGNAAPPPSEGLPLPDMTFPNPFAQK